MRHILRTLKRLRSALSKPLDGGPTPPRGLFRAVLGRLSAISHDIYESVT